MGKGGKNKRKRRIGLVRAAHGNTKVRRGPVPWVPLRVWEAKHRNIWCENYNKCLDKALDSWWVGWSCSKCKLNPRRKEKVR